MENITFTPATSQSSDDEQSDVQRTTTTTGQSFSNDKNFTELLDIEVANANDHALHNAPPTPISPTSSTTSSSSVCSSSAGLLQREKRPLDLDNQADQSASKKLASEQQIPITVCSPTTPT